MYKRQEYDDPATVHGYAVTYYRPASSGTEVPWTDDRGGRGAVGRNEFHQQDSYYPAWVAADSYTLRGTLLENRAEFGYSDRYGDFIWMLPAREWGYADNYSDEGRDGTWNPVSYTHLDVYKRQGLEFIVKTTSLKFWSVV